MNKVKFRAWYNGEMYTGVIIDMMRNKISLGFIENPYCGIIHPNQDSITIMQYTGIKDKKRTEEYPEGQESCVSDLVKVKTGKHYQIREIYQHVNGSYCIDLPVAGSTADVPIMLYSIQHEIVGNIHENPNLLKGSTNE